MTYSRYWRTSLRLCSLASLHAVKSWPMFTQRRKGVEPPGRKIRKRIQQTAYFVQEMASSSQRWFINDVPGNVAEQGQFVVLALISLDSGHDQEQHQD